jgi:hypothetical protein
MYTRRAYILSNDPQMKQHYSEQQALNSQKFISGMKTSLPKIDGDVQLSEQETVKLTETLKPKLLQFSRLRRQMKRDLLLKVEEEQLQHLARGHARDVVLSTRMFLNTSVGTIDEEADDADSSLSSSSNDGDEERDDDDESNEGSFGLS